MLKEKYKNAKQFVKEHKKEIIAGTVCIGAAVVTGLLLNKAIKKDNETIEAIKKELKNIEIPKLPETPKAKEEDIIKSLKDRIHWISSEAIDCQCRLDSACDVAYRSLKREKERIQFGIAELENYIANLDHTKNINIFHRIPEKEKMISDLKIQLDEINFDMSFIENEIGFLMESEKVAH